MKKEEDEVISQLKWRLSERPTLDGIERMIKLGVITKEDARKLLLDEEEVKPKSLKDLQNEIALLRELVLDISKRNPSGTVKIIERYYDNYWYKQPYRVDPWAAPYTVLCSTLSPSLATKGSTLSMAMGTTDGRSTHNIS